MTMLIGGYVKATRCTGGPTSGARALMAWYLGGYKQKGGTNLGIYNCRDVRGGKSTSLHGEGRAGDLGINPHGAAWGWDVARFLVEFSAELGVQCVIYARKIWSSAKAHEGWRDYDGQADHFDHIHVELTPDGARRLTVATLVQLAKPVTSLPAPPAPAAESPSGRLLVKGMRGEDVRRLQTVLTTKYPAYAKWEPVTDFFGNQTEAAVREFQKRSGLVVDGRVGPATRRALGL